MVFAAVWTWVFDARYDGPRHRQANPARPRCFTILLKRSPSSTTSRPLLGQAGSTIAPAYADRLAPAKSPLRRPPRQAVGREEGPVDAGRLGTKRPSADETMDVYSAPLATLDDARRELWLPSDIAEAESLRN